MSSLEKILELLLAEEHEKAEELLHEYLVAKARSEYEKVLESEDYFNDEDLEEEIDDTDDFESEIASDDDEIDSDEEGDEFDFDVSDEPADEFGGMDSEEPVDVDMDAEVDSEMDDEFAQVSDIDDELGDKVNDLEAELEDLRAEFEKLMSDSDELVYDEEDEDEDEVMDSVSYDLDEATQLSNKVPTPKPGEADASAGKSPYTNAPKPSDVRNPGKPVVAKDGSEGKKNHGGSVKDNTPTSNIKVDHKKGPSAVDGKGHADGSNKASPFSKAPK